MSPTYFNYSDKCFSFIYRPYLHEFHAWVLFSSSSLQIFEDHNTLRISKGQIYIMFCTAQKTSLRATTSTPGICWSMWLKWACFFCSDYQLLYEPEPDNCTNQMTFTGSVTRRAEWDAIRDERGGRRGSLKMGEKRRRPLTDGASSVHLQLRVVNQTTGTSIVFYKK